MVELDFTTGAARGLSGGAREAVRRSGRLPSGLVHPAVEQAWAAVNAAKAFEGKSATVADIVRARDGGWQVGQRSGWGAFEEGVERFAGQTSDPCWCWDDEPKSVGDSCGNGNGSIGDEGRVSSLYPGWVTTADGCEYQYECEKDCGCYLPGGSEAHRVGFGTEYGSMCQAKFDPDHSEDDPYWDRPDPDYMAIPKDGKCQIWVQCYTLESDDTFVASGGQVLWTTLPGCSKSTKSTETRPLVRDRCGEQPAWMDARVLSPTSSPAATPCKIGVGWDNSSYPHSYVVVEYPDGTFKQHDGMPADPSAECPGSTLNPFGCIYIQSNTLLAHAPIGLTFEPTAASCAQAALIEGAEREIESRNVQYIPYATNSNSVTYTLLKAAGLPTEKPRFDLIGWGYDLREL